VKRKMERALRKYYRRWEGRERIFYRWPEHLSWNLTGRGGIAKLQKLERQKTDFGHVVWLRVQAFTSGVNELTQHWKHRAVLFQLMVKFCVRRVTLWDLRFAYRTRDLLS